MVFSRGATKGVSYESYELFSAQLRLRSIDGGEVPSRLARQDTSSDPR